MNIEEVKRDLAVKSIALAKECIVIGRELVLCKDAIKSSILMERINEIRSESGELRGRMEMLCEIERHFELVPIEDKETCAKA